MFVVEPLVGVCMGLLPVVLTKVVTNWLSYRETCKLLDDEERERLLWYRGQVEGGMVAPYDYPDVLEVTDWR